MQDSSNIEMGNKAHKEIPGNPSTATSSKKRLNDRSTKKDLRMLSEADWEHWVHEGYVVIREAITPEQAAETAAFLWEFEEKDPDDPATWYTAPRAEMKMKELAGTGMVEVYNHQQLWDNRQPPKVYEAFVDIWAPSPLSL